MALTVDRVISAGSTIANIGDLVMSNSNNISFGINGQTLTASYAQSSLVYSNLNGVTFGVAGSTLTASVRTDYQSAGAYLTTAMLSNASSAFAGINGAMTGGSITLNTSGFSINLPAYLTTAQPVGAYLTTAMVSNNGSNFVGLNSALTGNGVSATINSSGISLNIPSFLTTAMLSNAASNFVGLNSAITNGLLTANSSGISLNLSNHLTTAMLSNAGSNFVGLNTALTANGVSATINSSGVSLNFPAFLTTAMQSASSSNFAGTGSAITNGTMTYGTGGLSLNLSNHLTTAMASNAGSNFLSVSQSSLFQQTSLMSNYQPAGAYLTTQTNQNLVMYAASNTTLNSATTINASSLIVQGAGVISVGYSNGSIVISASAQTAAAAPVNISAGTASANLASIAFGDANNVSFGLNGSTITASIPAYQSIGAYLTTAMQSDAATISNIVISAGASTNTLSNFSFGDAGGVSFGINGSVITASAPAGGGGTYIEHWEPFDLGNNTAYSSFGQNSLYMQGLIPQASVAMSIAEFQASVNFASSTNTQAVSQTIMYGLYSFATGASSDSLSQIQSSAHIMYASFSSNVSAGFTVSQGAASYTNTSAGTVNMANLTGQKYLYLPFVTTLSPGIEYFWAMKVSTASAIGTSPMRMSLNVLTNQTNLSWGKIKVNTVFASNTSYIEEFDNRVLSVTTAAMPTAIHKSNFSNNVSKGRMYLIFENEQ